MGIERKTINIDGKDTSLGLEPEFWEELDTLAKLKALSRRQLVSLINKQTKHLVIHRENQEPLSARVRVYIVNEMRKQLNSHLGIITPEEERRRLEA